MPRAAVSVGTTAILLWRHSTGCVARIAVSSCVLTAYALSSATRLTHGPPPIATRFSAPCYDSGTMDYSVRFFALPGYHPRGSPAVPLCDRSRCQLVDLGQGDTGSTGGRKTRGKTGAVRDRARTFRPAGRAAVPAPVVVAGAHAGAHAMFLPLSALGLLLTQLRGHPQ